MVYDGLIEGKYVILRSVDVGDAEFTLSIRQDPEMTKFLPKLDITLEQQRDWIQKQREKEGDYFFVVISKKSDERIGTIGIYNIKDNTGEGGRLALYGEVYEKIEAGILMSEFEFNYLKMNRVIGWVYCGNVPAIQWNKQFGAVFGDVYKNDEGKDVFDIVITRQGSKKAVSKLKRIIEKISS